ncbi:histone-lysine N-methyltransferase 2B isoform X1 [Narcine bancroftii]|uniref:histone-lysine N-methyltransferase 2B isoform X1 n=1 Tax=Narcine bancroftii TaxID=1343680 RepID=UPI003831FB94
MSHFQISPRPPAFYTVCNTSKVQFRVMWNGQRVDLSPQPRIRWGPTKWGSRLDILSGLTQRVSAAGGARGKSSGSELGLSVPEDGRQCALCLKYSDDKVNDAGRLLYIGQNEWTHVNCALWSAEVFEEGDGSLKNVHMAVGRGKLMRCEYCQKPGATVGCCLSSCQSNYHFMCARACNCVFEEDKKVYCQRHQELVQGKTVREDGFEVMRRAFVDFEGITLRRKFLTGLEPEHIAMMIGSLTINNLGVLTELSEVDGHIFPVGYQCSRVYWSTTDARKRCLYRCKVMEYHPPAWESEVNGADDSGNHTIVHSPGTADPGEETVAKSWQEARLENPLAAPSASPLPPPRPPVCSRIKVPSYRPNCRWSSSGSRPLPCPGSPAALTHHILTVSDPAVSPGRRSLVPRRHSLSSHHHHQAGPRLKAPACRVRARSPPSVPTKPRPPSSPEVPRGHCQEEERVPEGQAAFDGMDADIISALPLLRGLRGAVDGVPAQGRGSLEASLRDEEEEEDDDEEEEEEEEEDSSGDDLERYYNFARTVVSEEVMEQLATDCFGLDGPRIDQLDGADDSADGETPSQGAEDESARGPQPPAPQAPIPPPKEAEDELPSDIMDFVLKNTSSLPGAPAPLRLEAVPPPFAPTSPPAFPPPSSTVGEPQFPDPPRIQRVCAAPEGTLLLGEPGPCHPARPLAPSSPPSSARPPPPLPLLRLAKPEVLYLERSAVPPRSYGALLVTPAGPLAMLEPTSLALGGPVLNVVSVQPAPVLAGTTLAPILPRDSGLRLGGGPAKPPAPLACLLPAPQVPVTPTLLGAAVRAAPLLAKRPLPPPPDRPQPKRQKTSHPWLPTDGKDLKAQSPGFLGNGRVRMKTPTIRATLDLDHSDTLHSGNCTTPRSQEHPMGQCDLPAIRDVTSRLANRRSPPGTWIRSTDADLSSEEESLPSCHQEEEDDEDDEEEDDEEEDDEEVEEKENWHQPESQRRHGPHLRFEITSDDGFSVSADSIEVAWKAVLDKVMEARATARLKHVSFAGMSGLRCLGLTHDAVLFLVEQLLGAKNCRNYKFRFHKHVGQDELPVNPHGCVRAEIGSRKSTFDMFNFLASRHRKLPEYGFVDEEEDEVHLKSARRATSMDLPMAMRFRHLKKTSKEAVGVYRSAIHGRGLFCKRNIDAGEMVIEYSGIVIRSVLTDKREKYYDSKGIGCYMFRIDDFEVVDATMHGNAARFINHSCEPNCYSRVINVEGQKHIVIFAMRKIYQGEELTYDYKFPIEDASNKLPCNCGARKCRRFLN